MGLKSKYETHVLPNLDRIAKWAREGATAKDIAAKIRVAYSTFRKYLDEGEKGDARFEALSAAFKEACQVPDDQIETALFKRAHGIYWEEVTHEFKKNKETGELEKVATRKVTRFVPPDPTSAMFWLTNRRPDRWKYKPVPEEDEGEESGVVVLSPVMQDPGPPGEKGGGDDG